MILGFYGIHSIVHINNEVPQLNIVLHMFMLTWSSRKLFPLLRHIMYFIKTLAMHFTNNCNAYNNSILQFPNIRLPKKQGTIC